MQILKLVLVAGMALAQAPLLATTLVDGGFETKGAALPVNTYCYDNVGFAGDGFCATSPWINLGSNSGVIRTGEGAWGAVGALEGDYYGFIQVAGVLAQSFTATAIGSASISWIDHARGGYGPMNYSVSLFDGVTTLALGNYTSGASWTSRSTSAFALSNGTTYSLRFTGLEQSDLTTFIDDVSLATVPEPAAWAMLIAGFGLTGAAMRRRRAAIA